VKKIGRFEIIQPENATIAAIVIDQIVTPLRLVGVTGLGHKPKNNVKVSRQVGHFLCDSGLHRDHKLRNPLAFVAFV
jgi:hypothetical protein